MKTGIVPLFFAGFTKHSNRFNVSGVREHVDYAGGLKLVTVFFDQLARVPGQGPRMTLHVNDSFGAQLIDEVHDIGSTAPGRIQQHPVPALFHPGFFSINLREICGAKLAVGNPIQSGVGCSALNLLVLTFNAQYMSGFSCKRQ